MFFFKKRKHAKEIKTTDRNSTHEIAESKNIIVDGNLRNNRGMLSYQVANLQMIGTREKQEDSFAVINAFDVTKILTGGLFAIICDGMGGLKDGKIFSEAAVQGFVETFRNLDLEKKDNIPNQLTDACHLINRSVRNTYGSSGGTTVALTVIFESELYWMAVGDSSIYLKRNGSLIKLNKDHIYLNELYLKELTHETIDKTSVETAEQKESLTEYIGKNKIREIDFNYKAFPLGIGDTILLCSDGVSSYIEECEISKVLDMPPKEACAYVDSIIKSKNHSAQDNYTCIIISCE